MRKCLHTAHAGPRTISLDLFPPLHSRPDVLSPWCVECTEKHGHPEEQRRQLLIEYPAVTTRPALTHPTELQAVAQSLLALFRQPHAGGSHTPPEVRLLLYALSVMLRATRVMETGYDAGMTTEALCLSGATVFAVDNLAEYPGTEAEAQLRLAPYPNCTIQHADALTFLRAFPDESAHLIFIDDGHGQEHVRQEMIEVRRLLVPGGLGVFHDTIIHDLWSLACDVFADWERLELPAFSPVVGKDFGLGLVRKPSLSS